MEEEINTLEELIKQFDKIECKKEIKEIKINEEGYFYINENCIYKNNKKIIKHSLKIKGIQISETNILAIDEKNNLKVYSRNKDKYLLIRDYRMGEENEADNINSIGIYKYNIVAINKKELFLMKISSEEIKKIKHNIKIKEDIKIKYFNENILIKTEKNIYLINNLINKIENIFTLKDILGSKIISFFISEDSIVLLTNKYIFLNEKVIEFSGGINCKLFNNQLFVSTLNSLIVFNLNLNQTFIFKKINKFKFQINFNNKNIEIKKLLKFFNFLNSLNKENIINIENKVIKENIIKENSLINNSLINNEGILIFFNYKIFYNKNILNINNNIKKTNLFYKETPNELIKLNSNFINLEKQDFLIKRFKYSEAFNYLIELNNINLIIKYLKDFKNKNVLKFLFKNKENRIKVINLFIFNKNYLKDSNLFIYILDFLLKNYEIEFEIIKLKNILDDLFKINKDSCLLFGYLNKFSSLFYLSFFLINLFIYLSF